MLHSIQNYNEKLQQLSQDEEYENSTLYYKLRYQLEHNLFYGKLFVLFTDIDNTYIYREKPTEEGILSLSPGEVQEITRVLNEKYIHETDRLTEWLQKYHIPIIAVTGRNIQTVRDGQPGGKAHIFEHLPYFDVIASSLGTEQWIYQRDNRYMLDKLYDTFVKQVANVDIQYVKKICEDVVESTRSYYDCIVTFQHPVSTDEKFGYQYFQRSEKYKLSLSFTGEKDALMYLRHALQEKLLEHDLHLKVVVSEDNPATTKIDLFNIDIVAVSKRDAVEMLSKDYGCIGVFGGDSGNDTNAILQSTNGGIFVSNCHKELIKELSLLPPEKIVHSSRQEDFKIVKLRGDRLLLVDLNTERKGAASLLPAIKLFLEHSPLISRNNS